ncbi:MAG: hypothetical protein ACJ8CR_23355 [Roseiflexaceae bacterium]
MPGVDDEWRESSKVGGGVVGVANGAGIGAVRDVAGEKVEDYLRRYDIDFRTHYQIYSANTGYIY